MKENNYAFIDAQNVVLAIKGLGWELDFKRFRVYLRDKYHIQKAFLFIGYIKENHRLYARLQDAGFICIFKPTLRKPNGVMKGNCDAELVLHTMIQFANFDQALIVTGDGDFFCLVEHLMEKKKLKSILIPNMNKFSALLRLKPMKPYLVYMNNLENKLAIK